MSIDFSVVFWTIVNFSLLSVLLNKFLFKPVKAFMKDRQERIAAGVRAGEEARLARREEEERLQKAVAVRFREETELTRAEAGRRRQEARLRLEQAEEEAVQRRSAAKQALREEKERLTAAMEEKLPMLTQEMERKFLTPLEGDVSIGGLSLDDSVFRYLEESQSEQEDSAPAHKRGRHSSRRESAMSQRSQELDKLAEALAAELPALSSAIVKKIMGSAE